MVFQTVQSLAKRSLYSAGAMAKIGWYTAQYIQTRHIAGPLTPPGQVPRPLVSARTTLYSARKSFIGLFKQEADDIAKGVYKLPQEHRKIPSVLKLLRDGKNTLREAKAVARRVHRSGGATEVRAITDDLYPAYFRQNFHFQTDGWMSDHSAKIYDNQVEALFTGAASAMRRRVLPFITAEIAHLNDNGIDKPQLADIACGTGRLLVDIVDNYPALDISALDLSPAYLGHAQRAIPVRAKVAFINGNAEKMPYADHSLDMVMSVYLFHELPPEVRQRVAAEMHRVLKPSGLYIHADTVQYGDTDMDALLESFPRAVHEPYYDSYCQQDLPALFGSHGFTPAGEDVGFLTKVSCFRAA